MALHLLYADDFTGYASTAEFYAAYPYDPPTELDSSIPLNTLGPPGTQYVEWGLTRGPAGGPGIQNVSAVETNDPFGHGQFALEVDKVNLHPQCRIFRVKGTWDFADFIPTESQNTGSPLLIVWSYESSNRLESFDGNLVSVGRSHITGAIVFNITTTPAFANIATAPGAWKGTYNSVINSTLLESGGIYTIQIDGQSSILTEDSPGSGVWVPSTDGYVRVSVNGTEMLSFDGPVWHGNRNTNRNWNSVEFDSVGRFTDLEIYDETGCTPVPPNPPNCECTPPSGPPKPPGLPPVIIDPPPIDTTVGEQLACLGGGVVPTQADFIPVEFWWAA